MITVAVKRPRLRDMDLHERQALIQREGILPAGTDVVWNLTGQRGVIIEHVDALTYRVELYQSWYPDRLAGSTATLLRSMFDLAEVTVDKPSDTGYGANTEAGSLADEGTTR